MQRNVEPSDIYFYKHSIQSYATLPVAVVNASKPQLL